MHVEHIDPEGGNQPDNLCLSCSNCNVSKAKATYAIDPLTRSQVRLFNPRQEHWSDQFEWQTDGLFILSKTSTARATVERLGMNRQRIITARKLWVAAQGHPPSQQ